MVFHILGTKVQRSTCQVHFSQAKYTIDNAFNGIQILGTSMYVHSGRDSGFIVYVDIELHSQAFIPFFYSYCCHAIRWDDEVYCHFDRSSITLSRGRSGTMMDESGSAASAELFCIKKMCKVSSIVTAEPAFKLDSSPSTDYH